MVAFPILATIALAEFLYRWLVLIVLPTNHNPTVVVICPCDWHRYIGMGCEHLIDLIANDHKGTVCKALTDTRGQWLGWLVDPIYLRVMGCDFLTIDIKVLEPTASKISLKWYVLVRARRDLIDAIEIFRSSVPYAWHNDRYNTRHDA